MALHSSGQMGNTSSSLRRAAVPPALRDRLHPSVHDGLRAEQQLLLPPWAVLGTVRRARSDLRDIKKRKCIFVMACKLSAGWGRFGSPGIGHRGLHCDFKGELCLIGVQHCSAAGRSQLRVLGGSAGWQCWSTAWQLWVQPRSWEDALPLPKLGTLSWVWGRESPEQFSCSSHVALWTLGGDAAIDLQWIALCF